MLKEATIEKLYLWTVNHSAFSEGCYVFFCFFLMDVSMVVGSKLFLFYNVFLAFHSLSSLVVFLPLFFFSFKMSV